jgi:hypothetical protein
VPAGIAETLGNRDLSPYEHHVGECRDAHESAREL